MKFGAIFILLSCLFAFGVAEAKDSDPCEGILEPSQAEIRAVDHKLEAAKIWGLLEDFWALKLGRRLPPTKLVIYERSTSSGCGEIRSSMGPLYCEVDHSTYIDFDWWREMGSKYSALGEGARIYVLAHEFGHHVQAVLGVLRPILKMVDLYGGEQNWISSHITTSYELWADALAGYFMGHLFAKRKIDPDEVTQGAGAAARLGDDYVYAVNTRGKPLPKNHCLKHGTGSQRQEWFMRGFYSRGANELNPFLDNKWNENFSDPMIQEFRAPFAKQMEKPPF